MQCEIKATLFGTDDVIFDALWDYYPRKGEKIEIKKCLFVVEDIRHIIKEGKQKRNYVHLQLIPLK